MSEPLDEEAMAERVISLRENEFAELIARFDSLEEDVKELRTQLDEQDS